MPKVTLSIQERQEKLEQLALIDPSVLAKTSVKELRALCSGVITGTHGLNKTELVLAIQELVKPTRDRLEQERQLAIAKKEAEALELLAATKEPTAQAVRETHKATFTYISPNDHAKNILGKLLKIVSNLKIDNDAKLINIGVLAQDFVKTLLSRGEVTSVRSNLSDVRSELEKQLQEFTDSLHYERLKEAVSAFKQGMSITFEPFQTAYNLSRKATVVAKAHNQTAVDGQTLLAKATDVLNKIADGVPVDAYNTALALAAVTGRRLSEIFGTATEMTAVDYNTVSFKGQLKARNDSMRKDTAFNIPVLVDSALVITALSYLRTLKDRSGQSMIYDDPEVCKAKHGKPVSRAIVKYGWNTVCQELTFKTMRDIYAVMSLPRKPEGMTDNAYLAQILGHDPNNIEVATVYQKYYLVDQQSLAS